MLIMLVLACSLIPMGATSGPLQIFPSTGVPNTQSGDSGTCNLDGCPLSALSRSADFSADVLDDGCIRRPHPPRPAVPAVAFKEEDPCEGSTGPWDPSDCKDPIIVSDNKASQSEDDLRGDAVLACTLDTACTYPPTYPCDPWLEPWCLDLEGRKLRPLPPWCPPPII